MGNGFAVLDRRLLDGEQPFIVITHAILWCTTHDSFYATWATMPLHCSHCHKEGHYARNWPDQPCSFRACWTCGKVGHLSYDCPDKPSRARGLSTKKRRKVARTPSPAPDAPLSPDPKRTHPPGTLGTISAASPLLDLLQLAVPNGTPAYSANCALLPFLTGHTSLRLNGPPFGTGQWTTPP